MTMHRGYKVRIYPTVEQQELFAQWFGAGRYVWNWALETWDARYHVGIRTNGFELKKELTELKHHPEIPWLNAVPSGTSYIPLNLEQAFQRFFKKIADRPKFKSKFDKQSFPCTGITFVDDKHIKLPKIAAPIEARHHRPIPIGAKIKAVTLSKSKSGKYFVSVRLEIEKPVIKKRKLNSEIGLDLGLTPFVACSDGVKIERPKYLIKAEKRLKRLQRAQSRKTKGSKNRNKARIKLARQHEHVANQRLDFAHKVTRQLADENQVIYVEDLNVAGLCQGLPNLRKHFHDAGLGMLLSQLSYKLPEYGGEVIAIGRFDKSTGICPDCGCIRYDLTLAERIWTCDSCNTVHDRDIAAARVIKIKGQLKRKEQLGRDASEATSVERRATTLSMKSIAQARLLKQKTSTSDKQTSIR